MPTGRATTNSPSASDAIWHGELASWSRWLDETIPLVVGAFEALIATHVGRLTANFKRRLPLLAQMAGIEGVDEDFAKRLYVARSEGVHGAAVGMLAGGLNTAATSEVRLALRLLRRTLRVLVENEDFANQFVDVDSIAGLFDGSPVPTFAP